VSDTPRTDAEEFYPHDSKYKVCDADFARKLERELNAANDLIVRLQAITNDPHALWANWLRGDVKLPEGISDVRQYQDRINRLEDRIHRAAMAFFRDGSDGQVASGMLVILEEERNKL
jgi:hypothetical protein